jgi:signal transduction histidine kinase
MSDVAADDASAASDDQPAPVAEPRRRRRSTRLASRLPGWMGSIRFRLTALYSGLLFLVALIFVVVVYALLASTLDDPVVTRDRDVAQLIPTPRGVLIQPGTVEEVFIDVEELANQRSLERLRVYSVWSLAGLFVASLGIGWFVAGRVLRPIEEITEVARDIQATDLTRRIALDGPRDELKDLADTFDDLLGRLEGAFRAERRFIQDASHELRNPLAVMRTNLDVVLDDPDASDEELRHAATVVRSSAVRLSGLVDDLVQHAREEEPTLRRGPVDLATLVVDVAAELEGPAQARSLQLVAEGTGTRTVVVGDEDALRQALANLAGNAVRLAPEGSRVRIGAGREPDGWSWLAVADDGPGIPAEQHDLVFQRFWRGDDQQGAGGSGIGLALVRQAAEDHGGRVGLDSAEGQGSTFTIWLPPAVADVRR